MKLYCNGCTDFNGKNGFSKCTKDAKSKNFKASKTSKERIIILSKYAVSDSKKSRFIKKQASELLSSVRIKTLLSNIPLLRNVLF